MSYVIFIIIFIVGLSLTLSYIIFKDCVKDKCFYIKKILIVIACILFSSFVSFFGSLDLFKAIIFEGFDPGYTITIDDDLIEEYKLKLAEDEAKEDRRYFISNIIEIVKYLSTLIIGILTPFIIKGLKKFLHKRKKKRKKRKRKKKKLKRKIKADSKNKKE